MARAVDTGMDRLVVPGYTRVGYSVRRRLGRWEPIDARGRSVMVTGASSGLGEAVCSALFAAGAQVHMAVRDRERGEQARSRVVGSRRDRNLPRLHVCDVSDLESVQSTVREFERSGEPLDCLVHNAGVLPGERRRTRQGFELAFATNLLGPFLMTELALPVLRRSPFGAVIFVSSGGMYLSRYEFSERRDRGLDLEDEYSGVRAYARTKRGAVMLAREWGEREIARAGAPSAGAGTHGERTRAPGGGEGAAEPAAVRFAAMHPGWAGTPGVAGSLPGFARLLGPVLRTADQGADTVAWLAATGGKLPSGKFWHDRRERPAHRLPATRESAADRTALFEVLSAYTSASTAAD